MKMNKELICELGNKILKILIDSDLNAIEISAVLFKLHLSSALALIQQKVITEESEIEGIVTDLKDKLLQELRDNNGRKNP